MAYISNYGMALIESIVAAFILYFISTFINKYIPEEKQIPKKQHKLSSIYICLILLGISFGIRCIFETLGAFNSWFVVVNTDMLIFAIMATIFYFIHKRFFFIHIEDGSKSAESIRDQLVRSPFNRVFKIFILLCWIISIIFVSIPILGIKMQNPDIFNLGFLWAAFFIVFDILITILINRVRSIEKRIPKDILNYSMFSGGLVAFGIWSLQLIIFELYLKRLFGIELFEQDIRILYGVVSVVYVIVFYISYKKIFLPGAMEKSKLKLQKAFEYEKEQTIQEFTSDGNHVILDVKDLTTYFYTEEGVVHAVENVSFNIYEGEVLGLVGETGCGKSVTALSVLRLIRPPGKIKKGKVIFGGEDLSIKSELEILKYRGKDITMIFQDPLNSLNPVFRIGRQISEVFLLHMENEMLIEGSKFSNRSIYGIAREWSIQLLRDLNIPFPEVIIDRYPHELSGGMRQRVQIAMALACRPKLLIADEPTTALDVTIQNQILKLMKELRKKYNTTILFITHDLGIISKMCNRVAVMYSGSIVEYGDIKRIFIRPYHPYTRGLIASIPVVGKEQPKLEVIPGMVPNLIYPPSGCRFHPRCIYCFEPCDSKFPKQIEVDTQYFVSCHLYDPQYKSLAEISIKKAEDIRINKN
ncbi:MAG: ABC transporter ATP-binding protein [Candidatus Thorarchaeota archaeon]